MERRIKYLKYIFGGHINCVKNGLIQSIISPLVTLEDNDMICAIPSA